MDRESSSEIEVKYHKLATEYSKVRSHATVLKKALLDEQAKNVEIKELLRTHEQQLRKRDQEMDSLMFRNEQLSKRISVLQQELEANNRKGKQKPSNVSQQPDMTIINEELQKKIMENAQLLSSMADKDLEITDCKDKINWLEKELHSMQTNLQTIKNKYSVEIAKLKKENDVNIRIEVKNPQQVDNLNSPRQDSEDTQKRKCWQEEAERWKSECEVLRSKPDSNEQLTNYYESQISQILETKQICLSETKTLWAENLSLSQRLENLLLEHKEMESQLDNKREELNVTTQNYKMQLDAMTEHLAAQNDKITKQSDEIEMLNHRLLSKK